MLINTISRKKAVKERINQQQIRNKKYNKISRSSNHQFPIKRINYVRCKKAQKKQYLKQEFFLNRIRLDEQKKNLYHLKAHQFANKQSKNRYDQYSDHKHFQRPTSSHTRTKKIYQSDHKGTFNNQVDNLSPTKIIKAKVVNKYMQEALHRKNGYLLLTSFVLRKDKAFGKPIGKHLTALAFFKNCNLNLVQESNLLNIANNKLFENRFQEAWNEYAKLIYKGKVNGIYIGLGCHQQSYGNYHNNVGKYYKSLIQKYPQYDCPLNGLALCLQQTINKKDQFRQILDQLIIQQPQYLCALLHIKGAYHFNLGNIEQAKKYFTECHSKYRQVKYPYLGMAHCQRIKGNIKVSEKYYKQIVKQQNILRIYGWIGLSLIQDDSSIKEQYLQNSQKQNLYFGRPYFEIARFYKSENKKQTAIKMFKKAFQINEQYQQAHFELGLLYMEAQQYQKAFIHLENALKINPKYSKAYFQMGNIYVEQEKYNEAIQQYKKALKTGQQSPSIICAIGLAYNLKQQYKNSQWWYSKSIERFPHYISAYTSLSKLYKEQNKLQLALQCYKKCYFYNPKQGIVLYHLGKIYKELKHFDDAVSSYKKAIQLAPNYHYSYFNLGNIYKEQKLYQQAIKEYKKCIQIKPSYLQVYYALGIVYHEMKQYNEARNWYQKCIEINRQYYRCFYGIGLTYFEQNYYYKAIQWYEKCIQINEKYEPPYNSLGNTFSELKKYDEAIKYYNKAIELNANHPLIYLNKALALISIQNFKEAFENFNLCSKSLNKQNHKLSKGNQKYIRTALKQFKQEQQQWEHRVKIGFVSKEQVQRIKEMKNNFQNQYQNFNEARKLIRKQSIGKYGSSAHHDSQKYVIIICQLLHADQWRLNNIKQIGQLSYKIFQNDFSSFEIMAQILCQFFWNKKFSSENLSVFKIQEILRSKIIDLMTKFKPSNDRDQVTIQFPQKDKQKVNLFQETKYFSSYLGIIQQVEIINQKAKKMSDKFFQIAYKTQKNCKGFSCKANIKFPKETNKWFKIMIRILQKMFKQISEGKQQLISLIENEIKNQKAKSMAKIVSIIVNVWIAKIDQILKEREKNRIPTQFCISDIVRAKCMFKDPLQIKEACQFVISLCRQKKYRITQIQNRINKVTHDLVFKILIDGIVCQFQLVLETQIAQYQFGHSFYQIERSPLGCIFGSYLILSKGTQYSFLERITDLKENIRKKKDRLSKEQLKSLQYVRDLLKKYNEKQ